MSFHDEHVNRFFRTVKQPITNRNFGVAMYILTGMPSVLSRAQGYIDTEECTIDFDGISNGVRLSSGEECMVELANNLYGGSSKADLLSIKSKCDYEMCKVAEKAIAIYLLDGVM